MSADNPILNNPYEEPTRHYATDLDGNLDYADIQKGRRLFTPDFQAIPVKQGPQKSAERQNHERDYPQKETENRGQSNLPIR